jgi:hypothetical protein
MPVLVQQLQQYPGLLPVPPPLRARVQLHLPALELPPPVVQEQQLPVLLQAPLPPLAPVLHLRADPVRGTSKKEAATEVAAERWSR